MDIQEQVKLTNHAKRGVKLNGIDGIEIKNIEMLRLTPIELHSIITWKSITVHSKSLLLEQWTLRDNIARHLSLKWSWWIALRERSSQIDDIGTATRATTFISFR